MCAQQAHRRTRAHPPPRLSATIAATALAALVAGAVVWSATDGGESTASTPRPSTPVSSGSNTPGASTAPAATLAESVVVPERPRSARLPSGTVVPIRAVSTTASGRLDVPDDVRTAGWWRGGSRIGDPFGSTLLAAHVDSTTQGLGPYAQLLSVRAGQRITVSTAGLTQEFEVRSLRLVAQGSLADRTWIFAPSGPRRLTLVTCAPPYDRTRGGYQNLAIVTARPVAPPSRRAG
ncbi:putative Peptidase C60 sortase A and B [metagenome]|uniref:Putative Peptidase C60 sortase A and B n=1 Tax=metagenome TaxID=256318 RepID=A0A2P2CDU3_9ZZZZ